MPDLFAAVFLEEGLAATLAALTVTGSRGQALPLQRDLLWRGHNPLPGTDVVAPT